MHLKSLAIQGFKSFPERTVIEFHQGVTAIIGPNGSGKSNVTDAIRWVLGEQSVRTLRGSRMEDVIFTGTQSRRAMSFAEVSMTLDNSDGKLPLEYTEIQITRRLYRSGESEYLLNNTLCRLKDIATLFMDTGLGRDGYSIVGQGRVDDILSHRSEDRRRIFEEASGIVKFKTRKDEAERKLQQTEQNLVRINDIVSDLETRLEPLAKQAGEAKQFLNWRDQLRSLDVALMLDTIGQYQKQYNASEEEKRLLLDDLDRADQDLVDLKTRNRQTSEQLADLENEINVRQQKISDISRSIAELKSQIAIANEKKSQHRQRLETAAAEESQLQQSLGDLEKELAQRKNREQILSQQEADYKLELTGAETAMQALLATLDQAEKQVEQDKIKRDKLLEDIFEARNQQTETQSQIQLVESRRRSIGQEVRELISDRDRLQLLLEEKDDQLQRIAREQQQKEIKRGQIKEQLDKASLQLNQEQQQLDESRQSLQNATYRRHTLQDLAKNFEGYGETVRHLLKKAAADSDFSKGMRGTLGSLIRVEQVHETAIETALGPAIQNIVTDHEGTASRLIEYLKTNRAGRATFLPIASIRGRRPEADVMNSARKVPQFVGIASELVETPDDVKEIIDNLLGRVLIIQDLPSAVELARQIRHSCRIVTLDGDVINPGGSMTGGYNQRQGSGVLRRNREIEQLAAQISSLEQQISRQTRVVDLQKDVHRQAGRDLAQLEQQLVEIRQNQIREEARRTALHQEQERSTARQTMLEAEDQQLQEERGLIEREINIISSRIKTMEKESNDLREIIQTQEGANKAEKEKRNDLRETITDLRVSLHSIQESLQAAREMFERIGQEQKSQQERLEKQAQQQVDSQKQIEWLEVECLSLAVKTEDRERLGSEAAEDLSDLAGQRSALEEEQKSFFDLLEQAGSRIASIQGEISRCEAKASRVELQIDEIKNRLWETYELTADQAEQFRQSLENRTETNRQINQLRQSMRELGDVNLAAIEESSQIEQRHQFMVKQRDDIESSRAKLTHVIVDLTEAMKKQFLEHFELINKNFNAVFAELFGGGMAEVNLEDEEDVLACGIEIRAQPPGKRLQNLLLLSGGERCLTAIALLFAILKLRPTPFCVLDEVEAALDDANVSRFTDYIRSYSDDSQFILVTHRKGTMEAADRLYGVTMQERGISRILSMRLSD